MIEAPRVRRAAQNRLAADATLLTLLGNNNIFGPRPSRDAARPFILTAAPSGIDTTAIGGFRATTNAVLTVTIYGKMGFPPSSLWPIADRVDFLLQNYGAVVDGVEVGKLTRREGDELPSEEINGEWYPRVYLEYATQVAAVAA